MTEYVDKSTCKAIHQQDDADRKKIDEILVKVTQTAQWQKDHNEAHKGRSVSIFNIIMATLGLGSLVAVVVFGIFK